jgi:uncharacterized DUF497 family protein
MIEIDSIQGLDWVERNFDKSWIKHRVANSECEEVFFNLPLLLAEDKAHSQDEKRYYVLGQTNARRWLFISFTVRKNKIRVISARDMNQKEEKAYGKTNS